MWESEKCDLCGDCLVRCQYTDYDREGAVEEIKLLMEGKPAKILSDCITCCACNEYCPTGANPFDLINQLQESHHSVPIPEKMIKFVDSTEAIPSTIVTGDKGKPALSMCFLERMMPEDTLGSKMFEDMTVVAGGDYFCFLGYVHICMDSPLVRNARRFIDNLAAIEADEIVFMHADCYAMISKMPSYNIEVPFKATHIVEYMRNYLRGHPEEITPLNLRIAYQRPCASRYSSEIEPIVDELFELIGAERVVRTYDRESALCCGSMFERIYTERIKPVQEKNIRDAIENGAEGMVFLCPFCNTTLGRSVSEAGMVPILITDLVRLSLGEISSPF